MGVGADQPDQMAVRRAAELGFAFEDASAERHEIFRRRDVHAIDDLLDAFHDRPLREMVPVDHR